MTKQNNKSKVRISTHKNWKEFSQTSLGQDISNEVQKAIVQGSISSHDLSQENFQAQLVQDDTPKVASKQSTFKR